MLTFDLFELSEELLFHELVQVVQVLQHETIIPRRGITEATLERKNYISMPFYRSQQKNRIISFKALLIQYKDVDSIREVHQAKREVMKKRVNVQFRYDEVVFL